MSLFMERRGEDKAYLMDKFEGTYDPNCNLLLANRPLISRCCNAFPARCSRSIYGFNSVSFCYAPLLNNLHFLMPSTYGSESYETQTLLFLCRVYEIFNIHLILNFKKGIMQLNNFAKNK